MPRTRRSNAGNSLQAQVQQLAQAVANLQMPRQRSRGRSRSRSQQRQVVQAPAATSRALSRGRSPAPRRGIRDNNFVQSGTIRFTNREMFTSLTVPANSGSEYGGALLINANRSVGFLSKMGALFGRMRWISLSFEYESMVSSATDGVIAYGLDWSCTAITAAKEATTLAKATALNPSVSHPLWESSIRLPRAPNGRLNARTWYDIGSTTGEISSVASLYYYISAKAQSTDKIYGALWISYTVEFQGPRL